MPARETTDDLSAGVVTAISDGAVPACRMQHASSAGQLLVRATLANIPPAPATFRQGAMLLRPGEAWTKERPLTDFFNGAGPFYLWALAPSGYAQISVAHA